MPASDKLHITVATDGDVARAVLQAGNTAREVGFDASCSCRISTAVSELARNILKYAGRGELIITRCRHGARNSVEIVTTDHGPGIPDVNTALKDHVSTGGTLGLGLPGVKRLMDEFELTTEPGQGTRVLIRKYLV